MIGDIITYRFRPFLYVTKDVYNECHWHTKFTCPRCGSHNAEFCEPHAITEYSHTSSAYRCPDCGLDRDEDGCILSYVSDAFVTSRVPYSKQLSLFDNE